MKRKFYFLLHFEFLYALPGASNAGHDLIQNPTKFCLQCPSQLGQQLLGKQYLVITTQRALWDEN